MWNYPVSSFLRLLTPLYTETEKETVNIIPVLYFAGDCGEEERVNGGDMGDWGTRVRSKMRETGELG